MTGLNTVIPWRRFLPVLMIAGAFAFFRADDQIASVAAFTAGLVLLGAWLTTAVVEWHRNLTRDTPKGTRDA